MKRIMISGEKSGSGKTTITCGLLKALKDRNLEVSSFKCGPDYIDTMFHSKIIDTFSRNLDSFFCDEKMLRHVLIKNAKEVSVIEGVMGYFDGAGNLGSSEQIATQTETPVIIVIDCKGMAQSIGAVICGFLNYQKQNNICGFIFNRLPESLVTEVKNMCEAAGTNYLGRFPYAPDCMIESRHLGLVTAQEIDNLKSKVGKLAELCNKYVEIDRIMEIASNVSDIDDVIGDECFDICINSALKNNIKIAVAKDEAFCFHYEDNYDILRKMGCDIVTFSPLRDEKLPSGIHGLILNGGYPELYADRLSENKSMLKSIHDAVTSKVPTIAECGGFMYLHDTIESESKMEYEMASVIHGKAFKTDRLTRFGYIEMHAGKDSMIADKGDVIKAHEFHYWDSTNSGKDFLAMKKNRNIKYDCAISDDTLYAGFPHLYFYGNIKAAKKFVKRCERFCIGK